MSKYTNIIGIAIFFILSLFSFGFSQESMTITTYYPSPYGSYNELRANQMSIGSSYTSSSLSNGRLIVAGNVGIGIASPSNTLHVVGGIRVTTLAAASATTVCRDGSNDLSTCSSSRKFKEDITYLRPIDEEKILEDIRQTRLAKFKMKTENSNFYHLGLIAEESPSTIQFIDEHNNPNIDLLSAQLGYSWAAIKAMDRQIQQLQKENQELKIQIGLLRARK